jgi:hypothetical protein
MNNNVEKIILMLNFTNRQKTHFMRDYWFLNNIYMVGKIPEEWKKSTVITIYRKETNKWWRTIEKLAYLMYVINYKVKF